MIAGKKESSYDGRSATSPCDIKRSFYRYLHFVKGRLLPIDRHGEDITFFKVLSISSVVEKAKEISDRLQKKDEKTGALVLASDYQTGYG